MTTLTPALELRSIKKAFGGAVALRGASLTVQQGGLHMLLGENGAGKTTLLRIAAGFERADAGAVRMDGKEAHWRRPADAIAAGVAAVHQHFSLVPAMTVAENVSLTGTRLLARYDPRHAAEQTRAVAERVGLPVDPTAIVGDLPIAGQQRVEIIKALARTPRILILDEPTAVLAPAEARSLHEWLRTYVEAGNTAIVITHHVREARRFGTAITVLRRGRTVLESPHRGETEAEVVAAILGDIDADGPLPNTMLERAPHEGVVLRADRVSAQDSSGVTRIHDVSLVVRRGEVLGIAGVDGSGHQQLLRALAGRLRPTRGAVERPGATAFIPEDRLRDAIVPEFSLTENFALRGLGSQSGVVNWSALARQTQQGISDFEVLGAVPQAHARTLSGGNQQRLVLARELAGSPAAIVAENPTRGLDIRASATILRCLRDRAAAGAAVVVYSTDIDELIGIADRVMVCQGGALREVPLSADAIGAAMVGAA